MEKADVVVGGWVRGKNAPPPWFRQRFLSPDPARCFDWPLCGRAARGCGGAPLRRGVLATVVEGKGGGLNESDEFSMSGISVSRSVE